MIQVNDNFIKLPGNYLFSSIAKKVNAFKSAHPEAALIRLGIGDVTRPLPPASIKAMHRAVDELADAGTFHGYGPEQGYDFLIQAILEHDYRSRGVELRPTEIFVSDGAKSDTGNFGDILGTGNKVAVTDPVYPVYIDSNVMAGRAGELQANGQWNRLTYLPCTAENHFIPSLPQESVDMIYLCYPNNPTGTTLTKAELQKWVDYALAHKALILYDAAYEAFITDPSIPRSIFAIPGARECAIEFCSFSKTAGFTGTRCGYTVVPQELVRRTPDGKELHLNTMWLRRQTTKFNGVNYFVQRGAEAAMSVLGEKQCGDMLDYYRENARIMMRTFDKKGYTYFGGVHSPYVWMQCPKGMKSWDYFDYLLNKLAIVGTPGSGFGSMGEGYLRLTAFGSREGTIEAMKRIEKDSL